MCRPERITGDGLRVLKSVDSLSDPVHPCVRFFESGLSAGAPGVFLQSVR